MDKGWSWRTMLAAFGVHFSCGGLQYIAGYIRLILLQNADQYEERYITWITSIYSGFFTVVGPVASVLIYKCGCRASVIVGASLETLGLVTSFFVRDKWIYFISYSLVSGMGSGLTYTTAMVLPSFNFDHCLSMASGITISGQGIGLICMPLVVNFLFEKYGLQGTFLLLGGVTLQKWVFGVLMRPFTVESEQMSKSRMTGTVKNQQYQNNLSKATELVRLKSPRKDIHNQLSAEDLDQMFQTTKENPIQYSKNTSMILKDNSSAETEHHIQEVFCTNYISNMLFNEQESEEDEKSGPFPSIFASELEIEAEVKNWFAEVLSGIDNMAYKSDNEMDNVPRETTQNAEKTTDTDRQIENSSQSFSTDVVEHLSPKPGSTKNKMDSANDISNIDQTIKNKMDSANVISNIDQTIRNKMATEINVPDKMDNSSDGVEKITTEKVNLGQANISGRTKHNSYLEVLKIRKFIFFLLSIFLYSVPEETIYMMIPTYFVENGSSPYEVSYLLSLLGTCSALSRFLMGILANSRTVNIYTLFSLPFGIVGIATLLLPFYVQTFRGRVVFVIVFGLYNCSVYSLLNEIISRIAGFDNVMAAFGFVGFIKGISGIFGPPLAEAIASFTQNSNASFIFAGCIYMTCLVSLVLLRDEEEKK